jgi:hypothetical protein
VTGGAQLVEANVPVLTEWQQTLDRLIERIHMSRSVRLLATDRGLSFGHRLASPGDSRPGGLSRGGAPAL